MMRTFRLDICYDGTNYAGWQVQTNGRSIQGEIESAIATVTRQQIRVTGSGRTDAGVHAYGQVASCRFASALAADQMTRALNANLPADIRMTAVKTVPERFHAVRDAVAKTYRYVIHSGPVMDPFQRRYAWHIPQALHVDRMTQAARSLIGRHDFSAFEASGSPRASSIREVTRLEVRQETWMTGQRMVMEITANGFLYNMVRNITGSLVEVGREKQSVEWIATVLAARDRSKAGPTAPPHGLFLVEVEYASPFT